jgi:phosphopantetheine adenylyltransferase
MDLLLSLSMRAFEKIYLTIHVLVWHLPSRRLSANLLSRGITTRKDVLYELQSRHYERSLLLRKV